mmetsp:Transcript_16229/g.37594  ORF Transcript_16229/g.37594 Transcript_16229/m.37594 type:complete len:89 (-) Transcript_16229:142-408(-)
MGSQTYVGGDVQRPLELAITKPKRIHMKRWGWNLMILVHTKKYFWWKMGRSVLFLQPSKLLPLLLMPDFPTFLSDFYLNTNWLVQLEG